jgi:hypothetical protein
MTNYVPQAPASRAVAAPALECSAAARSAFGVYRHMPFITSDTHHSGLCRRLFLSDGMGQQRCRRHGSTPNGIGASLAKAVPVAPADSFDI